MKEIYSVQAQVFKRIGKMSSRSTQIPTFYLDSNVQGIINEEHARQIATDILNPFKDKDIVVSAYVAKVYE